MNWTRTGFIHDRSSQAPAMYERVSRVAVSRRGRPAPLGGSPVCTRCTPQRVSSGHVQAPSPLPTRFVPRGPPTTHGDASTRGQNVHATPEPRDHWRASPPIRDRRRRLARGGFGGGEDRWAHPAGAPLPLLAPTLTTWCTRPLFALSLHDSLRHRVRGAPYRHASQREPTRQACVTTAVVASPVTLLANGQKAPRF